MQVVMLSLNDSRAHALTPASRYGEIKGKPAMFFSLSKIGWFFLTPSNLLCFLLLIGAILFYTPWWRAGRKCALASLVTLLVAGLFPLGNILLLPLEQRFPPWVPSNSSPAGIIVLGGADETPITLARGQLSLNESAERLTEAVLLARRYPSAKLVFTGGDGSFLGGAGNEADDAREFFIKMGIPSSQMIIERESHNTYENAGEAAKLVQPRPGEVWLLVTSAHHMPRAVGCFRRVGFYVTPYPVDYRTRGWGDASRPFIAASEGLRRVDIAVHEWVGLFVYHALGYTSELLPGARTS